MSARKILLDQIATDGNLMNKHTFIIKKPFNVTPTASKDPLMPPSRRFKQLRSRSQNSNHKRNILQVQPKRPSLENTQRFEMPSRHKVVKTQQKKCETKTKQDRSTIQQHKSLFLSPNRSILHRNLKDYLKFIRALPQEHYQISASFDTFRKRNRREPIKQSQKHLFQFVKNLFYTIYKNLDTKKKENSQNIFNCCQIYFGCFEKVKLQIILSIYYANNLHIKLRPFIVYSRLILLALSVFTIDNGLTKLTTLQVQSFKLVMQMLIQCFTGLFEPIKHQEQEAVSSINQTFRMLKALGEMQKKLQIIQRQIRKINSLRNIFIEEELMALISNKQEWTIQQLTQKEMRISWNYLNIPPVPYLPIKSTVKPFTLVIELDNTLIFYDKQTKILKYRPYIDLFLHKVSQFFQIVAFTNAEQKYTQVLVGQIERNNRYFSYILSHHHLSYTSDGKRIKDISRLGRDLNSILIIDHLPSVYKNYSSNGLKISSWFGDKTDKQLDKMATLLQSILNNAVNDIRHFICNHNQSTNPANEQQTKTAKQSPRLKIQAIQN